jgi:ribosomal protein S19
MLQKAPKTKKPVPRKESFVKKAVKNVLRQWGCYQFWPVQTGLGAATLDCIACVPIRVTQDMVGKTLGAFVAIEAKREGVTSVTIRQGATIEEMRAAGAVALLINSTHDLEIEDQLLWAIRNGPVEGGNWVNMESPYVRGQMGDMS